MKVKLSNNIDTTIDIRKRKQQDVTFTIDQYLEIVEGSSFTVHYESDEASERRRYPASQFLKAYTHFLRVEKRSINDALRRVRSFARFVFQDTITSHQSTICQYVSSSHFSF